MYAGVALFGCCIAGLMVISTAGPSIKKGLCISAPSHLCGDFDAFSNVTWWYDWTAVYWMMRHHTTCTEFAPHKVAMVWGWREGIDYPIWIPGSSEYILGFNEPNHKVQGNLTPSEAAEHWPEIEAKAKGRPLVSPAAADCGGGASKCHTSSATEWFDQFFANCTTCTIDYLATHHYTCIANETMTYLKDLYDRYGKQIWLTEFACPYSNSAAEQLTYMQDLLPQLEAADYVFRYAWFQTRHPVDKPFIKTSVSLLLPDQSELTTLGAYYDSV